MNSKKLRKEPKQKQSNNPINSINPINAINIKSKKKETFDSETCENSNSNSENIKIKKQYKRSVDFYPKQMEIEEIDEDITLRRNTISKFGKIKNFVPQLKPIKIDIIPSKLRLNRMGFKDLKCNKDNKFLLYSNKYLKNISYLYIYRIIHTKKNSIYITLLQQQHNTFFYFLSCLFFCCNTSRIDQE